LLPADAVTSVIFKVVYQPGAGSQPWALQCRCEHEDQIPPAMPVAPAGGSRAGCGRGWGGRAGHETAPKTGP